MCQGEVCTDNANTNDANDRQSMIVQGSLVDKPNESKRYEVLHCTPEIVNNTQHKVYTGLEHIHSSNTLQFTPTTCNGMQRDITFKFHRVTLMTLC